MNGFEDLPILPAAEQEKTPSEKIVLLEERLKIDIEKVETGKVQINKKVVSEEVTQQVPVVSEEILIEHKPVNQYVAAVPPVRVEGETTIISVVKEVLIVEKRLMLVEEIHLSKNRIETIATVKETLQKDEVEINRIDLKTNTTTTTNQ